ncbi:hypothetical protein HH310_06320 [Actinoplanes sp. TBRC 11911]|uniref:LodA/GoxA family CTQ-dependent oxidase n=1 Tax=Actinoplanes sp. TBRC 11911 TaxID=2729386 RepID=UPI00145F22B5|nr:LodA/GoxA family CTQ-dependent oxidase [Actinoplanes sp. TBRC 11911]NMO50806.1 hypothetical protein [Actinoplanes sp. TBRC 11911]
MDRIAYCAIHPAIGIARVGDSPDEYFLDEPSSYKDAAGRVKRQAVRFRIFAYNEQDQPVRELTGTDADITWTAHLVNRKGAAQVFLPVRGGPSRRNEGVAEERLVIDPGTRSVSGPAAKATFDGGTFLGHPVYLGELRTDEQGRLLVLGGHGRSGSEPDDKPLPSFADNDGWHDDTADGPVTARVVVDGQEIEVRPAWVVVAPPDFAPAISNLVTLYDVAEQVAWEKDWIKPPGEVSFDNDIVPLLARAMGYQWVSGPATRGHRYAASRDGVVERFGDFLEPDHLALLRDPGEAGAQARRRIVGLIRVPHTIADEATARRQATPAYMPQLSGDGGAGTPGEPQTWFTVTPLQYQRLTLWADGHFTVGDPPATATEPERLDRAALEACVGGPFFPGIEMSSLCRDPDRYAAPFRFRGDQVPGCMTERMAVPWQADFTDCRHLWWPAQRPDDVIVEQDYHAVAAALFPDGSTADRAIKTTAFPRWRWDRGIGDQLPVSPAQGRNDRRHREMVDEWPQLGFLKPTADGVVVETERPSYVGLRHRDYFHIMLNLYQYPDFLPMAWKLANGFLEAAAAKQKDPFTDTDLKPFRYEERAFDARMDSIYDALVDTAGRYDPASDSLFRTREDVVERLRQSGPLNQTDGVWLRNVATIGPIDDLTGFLTRIWLDEVGEGDPGQNHANVFTRTLESVRIQTAPLSSIEYAQDDTLLESAFTLPLFQLVVSQFTEQFFPEILGMTLFLEWESVELTTTQRLLEHHKLDSTYYALHVAIDNAHEGHGGIAKRAVKRYLGRFPDDSRQEQWRRVWNGYVAFRTTGTLGADLAAKVTSPTRTRDRVIAMIEHKKKYGSLNHARVAPQTGMSNNLFENPGQMLDALVGSGQVVPGDPDGSPFMAQMRFGGHMYRVFTDEEQRYWADWIRSLPSSPPPPGRRVAFKPATEAPAPPAPTGTVRHLVFASSAEEVADHPRGTLLGHGSAH